VHVSVLAGAMIRSNVRIFAIDFDNTLIDIETQNRWEGSSILLAEHLRPFFIELIPVLLRKGIIVSIVSFSSQTHLIRSVLRQALGVTTSRLILVRGNDGSWLPVPNSILPGAWSCCSRKGKSDHILSLVSKMYVEASEVVTPSEVVLVDDDIRNIKHCLFDGVAAFHLEIDQDNSNSVSNHLFKNLREYFSYGLMSTSQRSPLKLGIEIMDEESLCSDDLEELPSPISRKGARTTENTCCVIS